METTWDGLPIAQDPPHGAAVVVYRHTHTGLELLLLHRAHNGPEYEGDWAWGPPAGARFPGEPIDACARRELREETGLNLQIEPASAGPEEWPHYLAEAPIDHGVELSEEHDRYTWCDPDEAVALCRPADVARSLEAAVREVRDELDREGA